MKILWVTNILMPAMSRHLNRGDTNGAWMEALCREFIAAGEHELVIATVEKRKTTTKYSEGNVTYYCLPDAYPVHYNDRNPQNKAAWDALIESEKPDIIEIWGTEFRHPLCALRAAPNTPSVVFIQGLLKSIARNYEAGLDRSEIRSSLTLRDVVKQDSILQQKRKYEKNSNAEQAIFKLCGNAILENEYAAAYARAACPDIQLYQRMLPINKIFDEQSWSLEKTRRHTVICNASGYTIKGLHVILHALAIVKERYPDVILKIPGSNLIYGDRKSRLIHQRGYEKYIGKLISKLNLQNNIEWLGFLDHKRLKEELSTAHVFVLGSAVENHSSSLIEAMAVGLPSIASYVGGVPEVVRSGENGFLYRFGEYEMLANLILSLFEDDALAVKFSAAGHQTIHNRYFSENEIYKATIEIYENCIKSFAPRRTAVKGRTSSHDM